MFDPTNQTHLKYELLINAHNMRNIGIAKEAANLLLEVFRI